MADKPPAYAREGPRQLNQGQAWLKLRDAFKEAHPEGHIVRIEDSLSRGVPDVYFCAQGKTAWVEIKTGYQKPTDLQSEWHRQERAAGGCVMVLTVRPRLVCVEGVSPFRYQKVELLAPTSGLWESVVQRLVEMIHDR